MHNNNETGKKPPHSADPRPDHDPDLDLDHERDNEIFEPDNENKRTCQIDEPKDEIEQAPEFDGPNNENERMHAFDEPGMDDEDDDADHEPAIQRKWIKNTVIFLLVAALVGNILAFWPRIYNMETLPFLFKSRELSSREEIQSYKEAVVVVGTDTGKGTGFHISNGYIVTNHHVIENAAYAIVQFPGNNRIFEAKAVESDAELDIALLKVDMEGQELPFIEIEREHAWEPGSHIYVIGNPLYFTQIVNEGKVLGIVPIQGRHKPAMAVDAPVFKGNSGSPVINEHGNAIAVIYAIGEIMHEGKVEQAGLAVPLHDLDTLLQDLLPE